MSLKILGLLNNAPAPPVSTPEYTPLSGALPVTVIEPVRALLLVSKSNVPLMASVLESLNVNDASDEKV